MKNKRKNGLIFFWLEKQAKKEKGFPETLLARIKILEYLSPALFNRKKCFPAGATKPDVVVRVRRSIVQIQSENAGVGRVVPIATPFEGLSAFPSRYLKNSER